MSHTEATADIIRRISAQAVPNVPLIFNPSTSSLTHADQDLQLVKQPNKKKCRGDRRRQRYRRQFYAQGLDSTTVEKLVKDKLASQVKQQREAQEVNSSDIDVLIRRDRVCHFSHPLLS